jgi:hypothetical protein
MRVIAHLSLVSLLALEAEHFVRSNRPRNHEIPAEKKATSGYQRQLDSISKVQLDSGERALTVNTSS